jgi:hypothetical protein
MSLGPNPIAMPPPENPDLQNRLSQLERELKELRVRVVALERMLGAGDLHASDSSTVQKKVVYDWQK